MSDKILNSTVIRNSIDLNAENGITISAGTSVSFGTSQINVNNTKLRGVVNMDDLILTGTINTRLQSSIFNQFEEELLNKTTSQSLADQYGATYGPTYGDNLGVLNAHGALVAGNLGGYVGNVFNDFPNATENAKLSMSYLDVGVPPKYPAPLDFYNTNFSLPINIDFFRPNLNNFTVETYNFSGIDEDKVRAPDSTFGQLYWPTDTGTSTGNTIYRVMVDYNQLTFDVTLNGPSSLFEFNSNLSLSQPYINQPAVSYVLKEQIDGYVLNLNTTGSTIFLGGHISRLSNGEDLSGTVNIDTPVPISINNPNLNGNISYFYYNPYGSDYQFTANVIFSNAVIYQPESTVVYDVPNDTTTQITQLDFPKRLFGNVNGFIGNIIFPNIDSEVDPAVYPSSNYYTYLINSTYQFKANTYIENRSKDQIIQILPDNALDNWYGSLIDRTLNMPCEEYYIFSPTNIPPQEPNPDVFTGYTDSYIRYEYLANDNNRYWEIFSTSSLYTVNGLPSNFNKKFWYYDPSYNGLISGNLQNTPETANQPQNPIPSNDSSVIPSLIDFESTFFVLGPYTINSADNFFGTEVYIEFEYEGSSELGYDYFSVATNIFKGTNRTDNKPASEILNYWDYNTNVPDSKFKYNMILEPVSGDIGLTTHPETLITSGLTGGDNLYVIFMYTKDYSVSDGYDGFKIKNIRLKNNFGVLYNMDRSFRIAPSIPTEINFPPNNPQGIQNAISAGNLKNNNNMLNGSTYMILGPYSYEDFDKNNLLKIYPQFSYQFYPWYNIVTQQLEVFRSNFSSSDIDPITDIIEQINADTQNGTYTRIFNSYDTIPKNNWSVWNGTSNENSVLYKTIDDYDYVYYTFKYNRLADPADSNQSVFISNICFIQNYIGNTKYYNQYTEKQASSYPNVYVDFNMEYGYYLPRANVKYDFSVIGGTTTLSDRNNIIITGKNKSAYMYGNLSNLNGDIYGNFIWSNTDTNNSYFINGYVNRGQFLDGDFITGNLQLYRSDVNYYRGDFYQYAWHANNELFNMPYVLTESDFVVPPFPFRNISGNVILQCGLFSEIDFVNDTLINKPIYDNQVAILTYAYTPDNFLPFIISFKYQLFTEIRGDFFYFQYSIDDGITYNTLIKQSGDIKNLQSVTEVNSIWKQVYFYLNYSQKYIFRWAYKKDINVDSGFDTVVLADIMISNTSLFIDNSSKNIYGNLYGNSIGTHYGNVFGNLYGNVFGNTIGTHYGNVFGNLYGNIVALNDQTKSIQILNINTSSQKIAININGTLGNISYTVP